MARRALASRLLAVMGPSGAGKSLLLHSLAQLAPRGARVPRGGRVVGLCWPGGSFDGYFRALTRSGTVLGNGAEPGSPAALVFSSLLRVGVPQRNMALLEQDTPKP